MENKPEPIFPPSASLVSYGTSPRIFQLECLDPQRGRRRRRRTRLRHKRTLVTTDLLLEGLHFDLTYVPLKHLGYKSAVVNFSDIYAMNGRPRQITVLAGLSKRFSIEDMEELYAGIQLACNIYGVDLVGGDTSASLTGLTISITCIGDRRRG